MNTEQDAILLRKLKQGDFKSYEAIFLRYYPKFHAFAKGMVKGDWAAEDLVQNVFMKLWIHREELNEALSLHNYLLVLTRNEVYNHIRLKNNFLKYRSLVPYDDVVRESVESYYNTAEITRIVEQTVEKMPDQRRRIYRLSKEDNLSNHEIADRLGLSFRTVEKHLELALKQIRSALSGLEFLLFILFL